MDNIHSANGNVERGDKQVAAAAAECEAQNLNSDSRRSSPPAVTTELSKETTAAAETGNGVSPSTQSSPIPVPERPEDQNNNNQRGSSPAQNSVGHISPSPSPPAPPTLPKVCIQQHKAYTLNLGICHTTIHQVHFLSLMLFAAGKANQPEEAVIRANRSRPESQV